MHGLSGYRFDVSGSCGVVYPAGYPSRGRRPGGRGRRPPAGGVQNPPRRVGGGAGRARPAPPAAPARRAPPPAATLPLGINTDPADFGVRLAGSDVTAQLHTPQVSGIVSGYARIAEARGWLIARMRQIIAERGRIVVEGRDITTVVAPDAQVRVLLKADATARIARRTAQLNGAADRVTVTDQVIGRDRVDALTSDFEHPAHGVVVIDSTDLSLAQVVERIAGLVPAPLRHSPKR